MNWTDDDLDLALSELKDEPLPPGATEAVRARVLDVIEKPRRRWWMWAWAPALAAGLMLWMVIPREPPTSSPSLRSGTGAQNPAPAATQPVPELSDGLPRTLSAPPPVPERSDGPPKALPARPEKETQFVKLVTDDPDVVILWAMNSEGDAQ